MNEVSLNIEIAAPVARVWEYLTDRKKLSRWLMDSDIVAEPGAAFTFTAEPSGSWDGAIHCEVTAIVERELISYTWNANDIGARTLVTFTLEEHGAGTRLTLTHSRFERAQPGAHGRHAAGWLRCLKALREQLEGPEPGYDWSEMQVILFVEAPVPEVFRAWATPAGMRSFWPDTIRCFAAEGTKRPDTGIYRNGDRAAMTFPTGGSTEIEIVNIERDRFVTFRFGETYGFVDVRVSDEDGRTRITLRQHGSPTTGESPWEIHTHARGWWIWNLLNLKAVLRHGIDLRVREPGAENGLSAHYLPDGAPAPRPHDWSAFDVSLYLAAPRERVLEVWRTAAGIESFFADRAVHARDGRPLSPDDPVRPGDTYRWRAIHGLEMIGEFTAADDDRVAFSFLGRYACEVSAKVHGGGTLLRLRQSGMRDDDEDRVSGSLDCRCSWIYYLTGLKARLEHGVELRDRNPETAHSVSLGFAR